MHSKTLIEITYSFLFHTLFIGYETNFSLFSCFPEMIYPSTLWE